MDIVIRKATSKDLATVVDWAILHATEAAKDEPRNKVKTRKHEIEVIEPELNDKKFVFYLAHDGKKSVGMVVACLLPTLVKGVKRGKIMGLHVDKKYRRKGIGGELIETAIGWLNSKKVNQVEIFIRANNIASKASFSKYKLKSWYTVSTFKI